MRECALGINRKSVIWKLPMRGRCEKEIEYELIIVLLRTEGGIWYKMKNIDDNGMNYSLR